eukprot:1085309-Rhodomonas_salina.1
MSRQCLWWTWERPREAVRKITAHCTLCGSVVRPKQRGSKSFPTGQDHPSSTFVPSSLPMLSPLGCVLQRPPFR